MEICLSASLNILRVVNVCSGGATPVDIPVKLKVSLFSLVWYFVSTGSWICVAIGFNLRFGGVKQFPTVNRVNMFWGESYNIQERPNISHGKVLVTCIAILGAQQNTIQIIN